MKFFCLFCFISFSQVLIAQTFTKSSSLIGTGFSSTTFFDADGDGDQDILITGTSTAATNGVIASAFLYLNDGSGNFSVREGTSFDGVKQGAVAYSDIDGDNDQDVLITGEHKFRVRIAKLYLNDGNGDFVEQENTPFVGTKEGSVDFADIDGDGDSDVLITGRTAEEERISKLYINDGKGIYIEIEDVPFPGVFESAAGFSDVDGDGDQDVMIVGVADVVGRELIAKLYINDGKGNFSEKSENAPFIGCRSGALAFADIDEDGDQDVLITGKDINQQPNTKLYLNDGQANFQEKEDASLVNVTMSAVAFSDLDNNGHQYLFITGLEKSSTGKGFTRISKLYVNKGKGEFDELVNARLIGVSQGATAFTDIDGDGDSDLLITGSSARVTRSTEIYINEQK